MNNHEIPICIREVEEADIPIMTRYRIDYLTELQGERSTEYKEQLATELNIFFKAEISEGRFYALLAEWNGAVVAFGAMVIKRIPGDFNQASYLEGDILNMYTIPEARRQGISSQILAQLLEEAKRIGISKVALHTSKDGEPLYRKFGFHDPVYPVLERAINLD